MIVKRWDNGKEIGLWEEIKKGKIKNLSCADLSDAILSGADLSGTDLRNANLSGATIFNGWEITREEAKK